MTRNALLVVVLAAVSSTPDLTSACEPLGEPKPWRRIGFAEFVAIASSSGPAPSTVRAQVAIGRIGTQALPSGPAVLVPWAFGADCTPLVWNPFRDGVWSPPDSAAFYTGRLRSREAWIDGSPTIDIEMAHLQPVWHGGERDRQRFPMVGSSALLTPRDFFDFYAILPSEQELNARDRRALARAEAWASSRPEMAAREPVRSMLRTLRDMWKSAPAFRVETVADGLINPWSMAFLPNGDILVTERPGRLRIIRKGVLDPRPIPGVPAVLASGQGGLLDVALHPAFATNRLLYLAFTKRTADGRATTEAIVKGRFDGSKLVDVTEIFEARMLPSRSVIAMAGRLAFDRDGYLYLTLGDRATPTDGDLTKHVAQDLSNHMGKTVRLHDDGRVPADNPFVGQVGALPEIWSYGHRNAQGMAFHPTTGELWQSESGAEGGDELNVIQRGANYGWPVVGFSREYGGAVLHDASARAGMEQPVHHWTPAIVPSGIMIYAGDRFRDWRGNIFVAGLGGQQLSRVIVAGHRFVGEEVLLKNALGRLRDVRQGPDGYIYLAIDGGVQAKPTRVVRLVPS